MKYAVNVQEHDACEIEPDHRHSEIQLNQGHAHAWLCKGLRVTSRIVGVIGAFCAPHTGIEDSSLTTPSARIRSGVVSLAKNWLHR